MASDKDEVKDALEEFKQSEDYWNEIRDGMLDDIEFTRMGKQWDEAIINERERDGRPVLTVNKCPSMARQVINDARQNKPAIKVHPADDHADVRTAEVLNGLIRNIEYISRADIAYDTGLECAVYSRMGFWRVDIDYASYDQFEMDILINRIADPMTVLSDKNSTGADSSDWNRCFVFEDMTREEFESEYPDADPVDFKDLDKQHSGWASKDEIRVAERWMREEVKAKLVMLSDRTVMLEDKYLKQKAAFDQLSLTVTQTRDTKVYEVKQQIITGKDILNTIEWPGRFIPVVVVFGEEFMFDGERMIHGMFEHAKDPMRMYNYWRSANTELVALQPKAPYVGPRGAFNTDNDAWSTANQENHPYLEFDVPEGQAPDSYRPRREPPPQVSPGMVNEIMTADRDARDAVGIHEAGLGMDGGERSGRMIHERRVESDMSNFHFIDNHSRSINHTGRILIDLIPHVYNSERVLRILGEDMKPQTVPILQPYAFEGKEVLHDFSIGKYDLTVETGPSFTTKRKETADLMQSVISAYPQLINILGDIYFSNLDVEGAKEMAKRIKAMLPPAVQALEELTDLPEEARVPIAQMKQQMGQMQEMLKMKDAQLGQLNQEYNEMRLQLKDKSDKAAIEHRKIDANFTEKGREYAHDEQMARIEAQYEERLERMKQELEAKFDKELVQLKSRMDSSGIGSMLAHGDMR